MLTYGFFNSLNGDRRYNAETISNMFKGLISDGIYPAVGTGFIVAPLNGMSVSVGSGRAVVGTRWVENDNTVAVEITAAHAALPRYSAVVLRRNMTTRTVDLIAVDGTAAAEPEKPAITRTAAVYDICLAYIYVAAGATVIQSADITDMRQDPDVCGYVHLLTSSALQRFEKTIKTTDAGSSVAIPSDIDYEPGDFLDVYISGLKISADDYDISENSLVFEYNIDAGAEITLINTKAMILGESDIGNILDEINGEVV